MSDTRMKTRIIQKHAIESDWAKAVNFTPLQGEIIIYDIDDNYNYERIKIGDGVQNVNDLPFAAHRSFVVTASRDADKNTVVDKTYQEIYDAAQAGMHVYMVTGDTIYVDGNSMWPDTILWLSYCSDYSVIFTHHDGSSEFEIEIDLDGVVSVYYSSSLPSKYSYGYEGMVLTVGENGEVNPADFPETIARISDVEEVKELVGDTSVSEQINTAAVNNQSDWSVNDETSPAYVKNRTHWLESEYIKFIDNETIPFILASEGLYASDSINNDVVFIEGNTYTFTIDGTSYDCVAHIVANYGYTYIGNVSYLDPSFEDTQEPFCVLCYNNAEVSTMLLESSGIQIATIFEGDSHVISLSGLVETYHKIDRKYLPHLVGRSGSEEGAEIFNNYNLNIASGGYAHAEGSNTTAEGWYSHAEGNSTSAVGTNAHAEGSGSYAEGINSHAEGSGTTASGYTSHAEGYNVVAASEYQHAQGKFNIEDANDIYAHIVGNGTNRSSRSNAHTISWDGIGWFANSVKVGGTGQDDANAKTLATTDDLNWDNLKDKPFYSSDNVTIFDSTITTSDIGGVYGFMDQGELAQTIPTLIEGETYTVIFNNDVYTCTCIYGAYLGNLSLLNYGDNTNEPFAVMVQAGFIFGIATTDTTSTTHTIKIEGPSIKTIDEKYLPELPYVTLQEGNQYWVGKSDFAQTNSNLTYKGQSYMTSHDQFMFFLTSEGIWSINLVIYDSAQTPAMSKFRMNYDSTSGTLYFYWKDESNTTEITTSMHAYLYDVNTGKIIRRESNVQSVTIGAYTKKSHNVDFYINKNNPQPEEIIRSFDDYIETYSKDEVDALIESMKPKFATVTLTAANWTGDANPWSQVVTMNGVTANSKVDLQPAAVQIVELQDAEITLMLQNDAGVVSAWAIGNKPIKDYTMDVSITEVVRV